MHLFTDDLVDIPTNVMVVNSTTTNLTVQWNVSDFLTQTNWFCDLWLAWMLAYYNYLFFLLPFIFFLIVFLPPPSSHLCIFCFFTLFNILTDFSLCHVSSPLISSPILSLLPSPFQVPLRPAGIVAVRYRINYKSDGGRFTRVHYMFPPSQELNASTLNTTISFLQSNTEYMIQVRMEVCYSACFSYLPGNYSELILASTNAISEKVYAAVSLTFRKSCLTLEIITLSIMG